jgi:1,4-alpha-glucan branching enzyme
VWEENEMGDCNTEDPRNKMKILMLTLEYPPTITGGVGRAVAGLSSAISRMNQDVTIFTLSEKNRIKSAVHGRVRVIEYPFQSFRADPSRALEYLKSILKKIDVVHIHSINFSVVLDQLEEMWKVPLIYTCHSTKKEESHGYDPLDFQIIYAQQEYILNRADLVICNSSNERRVIMKHYPWADKKIEVIPNGIDIVQNPLREPAGRGRILFVGRLVPHKGLLNLIFAMREIIRAEPKATLYIAGGHGVREYRESLKATLSHLNLENRVRFLGWLGKEELIAQYLKADVMAIPSEYEPFGLVALEALNYEVPVVSSNTGGLKEIISKGSGLLVPPGDAGAIARAVIHLLNYPLKAREMAQNGKKRLKEQYTWEIVAKRTIKAYKKATAKMVNKTRPSPDILFLAGKNDVSMKPRRGTFLFDDGRRCLLYSPSDGKFRVLNNGAQTLWKLLLGDSSFDEVWKAFSSSYQGVNLKELRMHYERFITDIYLDKLIEIEANL